MILITGATGFVGSALCRHVKLNAIPLRIAVRKSRPKIAEIHEGSCDVGDIDSNTNWSSVLNGVDVVIHLASLVHDTNDLVADPLTKYHRVNTAGTERLARMAAAAKVKRFVYLSSVKVNGEGSPTPYKETDKPGPIGAYSQSKWEAEQVLLQIAAETGLEVVIIRPPLVYGPGVKANFLSLLNIVHRGFPLPFGSVYNRRSFVYLGNLIDAIFKCIDNPKAAGQTFFVSDNEDVSTPELIKRISKALGKPNRVFSFPPSIIQALGHILGKRSSTNRLLDSLCVDSSKICNDLDWSPPYSIEQGLKETAEWFLKEKRKNSEASF